MYSQPWGSQKMLFAAVKQFFLNIKNSPQICYILYFVSVFLKSDLYHSELQFYTFKTFL